MSEKVLILLLLLLPYIVISQNIDEIFSNKGDVYFSFKYKNKNQIDRLSNIISIDHKTNSEIAFAYANQEEFVKFLVFTDEKVS